jgi:hypothetical protein
MSRDWRAWRGTRTPRRRRDRGAAAAAPRRRDRPSPCGSRPARSRGRPETVRSQDHTAAFTPHRTLASSLPSTAGGIRTTISPSATSMSPAGLEFASGRRHLRDVLKSRVARAAGLAPSCARRGRIARPPDYRRCQRRLGLSPALVARQPSRPSAESVPASATPSAWRSPHQCRQCGSSADASTDPSSCRAPFSTFDLPCFTRSGSWNLDQYLPLKRKCTRPPPGRTTLWIAWLRHA